MDHYPVKRRGEKRRLNPNTEGVAWLDARAGKDAEITWESGMDDRGQGAALNSERAVFAAQRGNFDWDCDRPAPRYIRPMFQPLATHSDTISGDAVAWVDPCPNCYDFAYTWNCPEHPREGRKGQYATVWGDGHEAVANQEADRAARRYVVAVDGNDSVLSWEVERS